MARVRVRTHYQELFPCGTAYNKTNITACYENAHLYLSGHYVRVLGKMGEFEGEETPFCREQRPNGRPKAVSVRLSLDGHGLRPPVGCSFKWIFFVPYNDILFFMLLMGKYAGGTSIR